MNNANTLYSILRQVLSNPVFTTENKLQPKPGAQNSLSKFKDRIMQLSCDQAEFISKVLLEDFDCITCIGEAGSGKSFTLKLLRDITTECFNSHVLTVSSMGICAQNVDGKTLHSTFGIKLSYPLPREVTYMVGHVLDSKGNRVYKESFREKVHSIAYKALPNLSSKERDLIIFLDEFATTPSQYLIAMHQIAEHCRNHGHIKWVLIGDPNQALLVDHDSKINTLNYPWEPAVFVNGPNGETVTFNSLMFEGPFVKGKEKAWKSGFFALLSNHRQGKEFEFINSLRTISKGDPIDNSSIINARLFDSPPATLDLEQATFIFASNKRAQAHNKFFFDKASVKHVYKAFVELEGVAGYIDQYDPAALSFSIVDSSTHISYFFEGKKYQWLFSLYTPLINEIYLGQRFMITENQAERNLYNGMIGVVTHLDTKYIKVDFNGDVHTIFYTNERSIPETPKTNKPIAVIKRLPGMSANAITCNKSLGKTFTDPVVLVLNKYQWPRNVQNSGWVYVALSRVTSVDNIYIVCEDCPTRAAQRALLNKFIYTQPSCKAFVAHILDFIINSPDTSPAVKALATPKASLSIAAASFIGQSIRFDSSFSFSLYGVTESIDIVVWADAVDLSILGYEVGSTQYSDNLDSLHWHPFISDFIRSTNINTLYPEFPFPISIQTSDSTFSFPNFKSAVSWIQQSYDLSLESSVDALFSLLSSDLSFPSFDFSLVADEDPLKNAILKTAKKLLVPVS